MDVTTDGGFVVAGRTGSWGLRAWDVWIFKTDAMGNIEWEKTYGGTGEEWPHCVRQTADGGYVVAGTTHSFQADSYDYWVVKLDEGGEIEWERTYHAHSGDRAWSIEQTSEGGYIVAGWAGFGVTRREDFWILKLDQAGTVEWENAYSSSGEDEARSIQQTTDGGYIIAGWSSSFTTGDGDDLWILKLSPSGLVEWEKAYIGEAFDRSFSIRQTTDGGYVVAGCSSSFDDNWIHDAWILKLDMLGNVVWEKAYGGEEYDRVSAIRQTLDGGFITTGYTESFGAGDRDIWVLKLDAGGNVEWEKTYGGPEADAWHDSACDVRQTPDGGYIVGGETSSFGMAFHDIWLLRLDENGDITPSCAIVGESRATVTSTDALVVETWANVFPTAAAVFASSASVTDTDALVCEQCPGLYNPGEARFVAVDKERISGGITFSFAEAPNATHHVIYRGNLLSLLSGLYDHTVLISDTGGCPGDPFPDLTITHEGAWVDPEPYYYLVVGNSECCEGGYGSTGRGEARPGAGEIGGNPCASPCQ